MNAHDDRDRARLEATVIARALAKQLPPDFSLAIYSLAIAMGVYVAAAADANGRPLEEVLERAQRLLHDCAIGAKS